MARWRAGDFPALREVVHKAEGLAHILLLFEGWELSQQILDVRALV